MILQLPLCHTCYKYTVKKKRIKMLSKKQAHTKSLLALIVLFSTSAWGMKEQIIFKEKPLQVLETNHLVTSISFSPNSLYYDLKYNSKFDFYDKEPLIAWNPNQPIGLKLKAPEGVVLHNFAHNSDEIIDFSKYGLFNATYLLDATFTPDGKKIIFAFYKTLDLYAYDIKSKKINIHQQLSPSHEPPRGLFKFIEHGKYALYPAQRKTILFDIENNKISATLDGSPEEILISQNQKYFALARRGDAFDLSWSIYEVKNPSKPLITNITSKDINNFRTTFSGDGSYFLTSKSRKDIKIFDLSKTPVTEKSFDATTLQSSAAIDPSHAYLILGESQTNNKTTELNDLLIYSFQEKTPTLLQKIAVSDRSIDAITFSPDGTKLGITTSDQSLVYESNLKPIDIKKPRIDKLYNTGFKFE